MFLMWGYDGEEIEDIAATVEHVKKCNPDIFLTTVAYPIKNTGYFRKTADQVVLDKEWASATDRDHRIRGRHSRQYYKYADQWLKNEVAAFRLEDAQANGGAEVMADHAAIEEKRAVALKARQMMQEVAAEIEA